MNDNISLINITDVQAYNYISPNYDQNRFDALLLTVQRINLRELLDEPLYYSFFNDFSGVMPQTQKYKDLLYGVIYEYDGDNIQYYGLKPFLCFHWLAYAIEQGDTFFSDYGIAEFADNDQDNLQKASNSTRFKLAASFRKNASKFENEIKQFLNEKDNDYPEWDCKPKKSVTKFTMFHT